MFLGEFRRRTARVCKEDIEYDEDGILEESKTEGLDEVFNRLMLSFKWLDRDEKNNAYLSKLPKTLTKRIELIKKHKGQEYQKKWGEKKKPEKQYTVEDEI